MKNNRYRLSRQIFLQHNYHQQLTLFSSEPMHQLNFCHFLIFGSPTMRQSSIHVRFASWSLLHKFLSPPFICHPVYISFAVSLEVKNGFYSVSRSYSIFYDLFVYSISKCNFLHGYNRFPLYELYFVNISFCDCNCLRLACEHNEKEFVENFSLTTLKNLNTTLYFFHLVAAKPSTQCSNYLYLCICSVFVLKIFVVSIRTGFIIHCV